MVRTITYSLRLGARDSDDYHRAVARFADEWTAAALRIAGEVIAGFREGRRRAGLPDRTEAECAFELLALGVLLREHGGEAARSPGWALHVLAGLATAQDRWPRVEGAVKAVRGWIGWMVRRRGEWQPGLRDVTRLIQWLRANGLAARADRLTEWLDYLTSVDSEAVKRALDRSLALAARFSAESLLALGKYTEQVDHFLSHTAPGYRWRYDAEFVSRSRLEHHLGMLGTEVLNREYRKRFLSARRKVVIVPPCMRAQSEEKCKAVLTPFGARCAACTPTCRVHQVTRLGEKRGFEVYIIPDELRVFGKGVGEGRLGVVGVSCALTNWSGGWEAESLGVSAQGLLLDHVGCRYHWDEKGIPTDTNFRRLMEVVGAQAAPRVDGAT